MDNIKNFPAVVNNENKVVKNKEWGRKVLISVLIAAAAGAIMFVCYLLINGQTTTEGVITIVVVTIFGLIFSMSLLDKLGF